MAKKHEHAILYDGRCTLCTSSKRFVEAIDWRQKFSWVNFFDQAYMDHIHCISSEELDDGMAVITTEGKIHHGYDAWRFILLHCPLTFLSALCLYLPPLPWLGTVLYNLIARNRKRWFKQQEACDLPVATQLPFEQLPCYGGIEKANHLAQR